MKLKHKLILVFVTISILAVIAVSLTGYNYFENNSKKEIDLYLHAKTDEVVADLDKWIINQSSVIYNLEKFLQTNVKPDKIDRNYLQIFKSYSDISDIYIGFKNGRFVSAKGWIPPNGYDPRIRPWYMEAKAADKLNFSEPYLDMTTHKFAISVGMPLEDKSGSFKGIIGEDILLTSIINMVKNINTNGLGYGFLIDKRGIALYHPNTSLINTNLKNGTMKAFIKDLQVKKNGQVNYKLNNEDKVIVFKQLPSTGWILCLVVDIKIAYKPLNDLKNNFIFLNVLIFILLILITMFFSRTLTKPIYELIRGTEEIARGNLDKKLIPSSRDEIGLLAEELNKMSENLKHAEQKLHRNHEELEMKVEERTHELYVLNEDLNIMFEGVKATNQELNREISERRKIEKQLELKNHELETAYDELKNIQAQVIQQEKMASIGQLAAGVAHEINSPLGYITSNIETLKKYLKRIFEYSIFLEDMVKDLIYSSKDNEVNTELIDKTTAAKRSFKVDFIKEDTEDIFNSTLDGANRIKNIVKDLRTFSRISSETNLYDINAGIESVINIIWNEIKYKVTMKKELGIIPMTRCNIGQLEQVFLNILMNATHAIENQGEINIKTLEESGFILIKISDTGKGIPENIMSRIFDPFFTTKEVGKGTGLGLSISYEIVKKHNGSIEVESTVGVGTMFTIKIPIILE